MSNMSQGYGSKGTHLFNFLASLGNSKGFQQTGYSSGGFDPGNQPSKFGQSHMS
jgi:hypothetical protein